MKYFCLGEKKEETKYTAVIRGLLALSSKLELYHTFSCIGHSDLNKEYASEVTGPKLVQLGEDSCHICS